MASPLVQAIAFQNAVQPAQSGVAPADVVGAYKLSSDIAEKNYQAKLQAMQALWGGLAQLGAAGILGYGKPLAGKLFGSAATPAASGAAGTAAGDLAPVASSTSWAAPTAADAGGATVAGDLAGTAGADAAAGSVAADLGAGAAGTAMADMAVPDFLASFLPFLA